jgi:hypothetical protein
VFENRGVRIDADRLAHCGAIVARVWNDTEKSIDRFACLRRIGIDAISYKRHHHYLTVVG